MAQRKRTPNNENGSVEKKLDKLADDIKKLPKTRQDQLKDLLGKRAYSPQDAVSMLGISMSTLRRLMHSGVIKFFRIGRRLRIAYDEIERFRNTVNLEEAAKILGVHPQTIRRMIVSGKLPAFRIGRPYRIAVADIEKIMGTDLSQDIKKENK